VKGDRGFAPFVVRELNKESRVLYRRTTALLQRARWLAGKIRAERIFLHLADEDLSVGILSAQFSRSKPGATSVAMQKTSS
jgi:hypothetical protein